MCRLASEARYGIVLEALNLLCRVVPTQHLVSVRESPILLHNCIKGELLASLVGKGEVDAAYSFCARVPFYSGSGSTEIWIHLKSTNHTIWARLMPWQNVGIIDSRYPMFPSFVQQIKVQGHGSPATKGIAGYWRNIRTISRGSREV